MNMRQAFHSDDLLKKKEVNGQNMFKYVLQLLQLCHWLQKKK